MLLLYILLCEYIKKLISDLTIENLGVDSFLNLLMTGDIGCLKCFLKTQIFVMAVHQSGIN